MCVRTRVRARVLAHTGVQGGQCCTGSCELPRMGAKSQALVLCKISLCP